MPRKPKSLAERLTGVPDRRVRGRLGLPPEAVTTVPAETVTAQMPVLHPDAQMVTVTVFRGGPEDWGHALPPVHAAVTPARATWVVFDRVDGIPVNLAVVGPALEFQLMERGIYSAWFRNERGAPIIAMALGACEPGDLITLGANTPPGEGEAEGT